MSSIQLRVGVAVAFAALFGMAGFAAEAVWVAKGDSDNSHADHHFMIADGAEEFDLSDLKDGETREFVTDEKTIVATRKGDEVRISTKGAGSEAQMELTCSIGTDTCKVFQVDSEPERIMMVIQKRVGCGPEDGECEMELENFVMGEGMAHGEAVFACGDEDDCPEINTWVQELEDGGAAKVIVKKLHAHGGGDEDVVVIKTGEGPVHVLDLHEDKVLLSCPEGDAKLHVDREEADQTYLCPKHSVPMEKQSEKRVIRRIKVVTEEE